MNKKTRNFIYRQMLDEMHKDYLSFNNGRIRFGLCYYLHGALFDWSHPLNIPYNISHFPELIECRPENKSIKELWWPTNSYANTMTRIMIVQRAIELTN